MSEQCREETEMTESVYQEIIEPAGSTVYTVPPQNRYMPAPRESEPPAGTEGNQNMWMKVAMGCILFCGSVAVAAFIMALITATSKVCFILKLKKYDLVLKVRFS